MERLTVNDLNKVCYDPWELCGMDNYCKKGCHEEGGCTKGCHILKIYRKLAEYEDLEEQCVKENSWGLRVLLHKWKEFIEDIQELYEYRKLEEQGRLLKLPCEDIYKSGGDYLYYIFEDEIVECINCGVQIEPDGNLVFTLAAGEKIFPYRSPDSEHDLSPEDWCQETITLSVDEWGKTVFPTEEEACKAILKEMGWGE